MAKLRAHIFARATVSRRGVTVSHRGVTPLTVMKKDHHCPRKGLGLSASQAHAKRGGHAEIAQGHQPWAHRHEPLLLPRDHPGHGKQLAVGRPLGHGDRVADDEVVDGGPLASGIELTTTNTVVMAKWGAAPPTP